ncbi:MAG: hypothetical protein DWQ07_17065 [Chloroflexi bacterium]|nr:MAG: hypothetical protein DWQ07_17065 [Chloroflexota bacterium]MBL1195116.1 hypothetical protein [Chloroflexota bacterium]NOH12401.1 hypothetical protein [Chloroflexota bacterium]
MMINISAKIDNWRDGQKIILTTNNHTHELQIPANENGNGSKANGGETLFLALATCYCNDIYREAKQWDIEVTQVEVTCEGSFEPIPGSIAQGVT